MSDGRAIVSGAASLYGAQVATMFAQFAYATITSRVVAPEQFGLYGIALAVTALTTLLTNGGLAQTAARLIELDPLRVRALNLLALTLGTVGALALVATADFWSWLWGAPEASGVVRVMALAALIGPTLGLTSGLMRRQGRFALLAIITVGANVVGLGLGAVAAITWRNAESLLVAPLASQVILVIALSSIQLRLVYGRIALTSAREDLRFSLGVTGSTILAYIGGNVGKLATTHVMGPAALGQWNRADVITFVPFQQIQVAITQAVYPEFRHDRKDGTRAREAWPDMLLLASWIAFPIAGLVAGVGPHLIPVLFGPGWEVASSIVPVLSLISALQIIVAILGSAIESLARFKIAWLTQAVGLTFNAVGAIWAFISGDWTPIFIWIALGLVAGHVIQVIACSRIGYFRVRKWVASVWMPAGLAVLAWVSVYLGVKFGVAIAKGGSWAWLLLVALLVLITTVAMLFRRHLPPVRLAVRYGLLGAKRFGPKP